MSKTICILVDCLSSGGAEKVASNLSISLTNRKYKVTIVTMRNELGYSYKGKLYNFGLIKEQNSRIHSLFLFKSFFKKANFDVIIDHRIRSKFFKEFLFSKYVFYKYRVVYCVHSYDLNYYFSFIKWPKLAILPHVKQRSFVSVSNDVHVQLLREFKIESKRIYNYVLPKLILKKAILPLKNIDYKYIIGVGRLTESKQFDVLISCYSVSNLVKENIKLIILGDGLEKDKLKLLISELELENYVELLPFNKNPYNLIYNAKYLVLSSKTEGFPMTLIESLALNVPVISFDCNSGPREIIEHEINGILVENKNKKHLTEALNKLCLNESFYKNIKENKMYLPKKFSEGYVVQEWINLLESQR